ncbi:MAG: serine hydrolase [Bryobacteraceae bacterium]
MKICSFALVLAALPAFAQPTVIELLEQKTLDRVRAVNASLNGVLGFHAIDLTTGHTLFLNSGSLFPQASSIKIAIMIQMFRSAREGAFKMTDPVTLDPKETVGGSGHLQILLRSGPITMTVRELVGAMIETSDNTATNRCIAMVGMERVNRTLAEMGFRQTRLQRRMLDTAAALKDEENISTPQEMAHLVDLIYHGKAVDAEASKEMLVMLQRVNADMRKVIPGSIAVAAKPGELTGVRCETGIVFLPNRPFALSVASTFLDDGRNPVGEVTRIIYEHFEKLAHSNKYGNKLQ